jgi:hypothetical protein
MENTQVEELGQSITKRLHSTIMSLLRAYHTIWKVDDLPVLLNFLKEYPHAWAVGFI